MKKYVPKYILVRTARGELMPEEVLHALDGVKREISKRRRLIWMGASIMASVAIFLMIILR